MADYKLFSPHNSEPFGTLEIILTNSILQMGTWGSKQDSSSFLQQSFSVSQQKKAGLGLLTSNEIASDSVLSCRYNPTEF